MTRDGPAFLFFSIPGISHHAALCLYSPIIEQMMTRDEKIIVPTPG